MDLVSAGIDTRVPGCKNDQTVISFVVHLRREVRMNGSGGGLQRVE